MTTTLEERTKKETVRIRMPPGYSTSRESGALIPLAQPAITVPHVLGTMTNNGSHEKYPGEQTYPSPLHSRTTKPSRGSSSVYSGTSLVNRVAPAYTTFLTRCARPLFIATATILTGAALGIGKASYDCYRVANEDTQVQNLRTHYEEKRRQSAKAFALKNTTLEKRFAEQERKLEQKYASIEKELSDEATHRTFLEEHLVRLAPLEETTLALAKWTTALERTPVKREEQEAQEATYRAVKQANSNYLAFVEQPTPVIGDLVKTVKRFEQGAESPWRPGYQLERDIALGYERVGQVWTSSQASVVIFFRGAQIKWNINWNGTMAVNKAEYKLAELVKVRSVFADRYTAFTHEVARAQTILTARERRNTP